MGTVKKFILWGVVAINLLFLGAGCSRQSDISSQSLADLQKRLETLEAQNKTLQTQNMELQDKLAASQDAPTSDREVQQSTATVSGAETNEGFIDINDIPQKTMIEDLAKLHIFEGFGKEFKPYQSVTRGEYVTWLFKAYNAMMPQDKQIYPAPQIAPKFKDLSSSHAAYPYAQALANAGYSVGYEDGTFKADQPITREEMLGIKVGVDRGDKTVKPGRSGMINEWKFTDSDQVDERFTGYVRLDRYVHSPLGSNIERAFGKSTNLKPKQQLVRAEAAATLWACVNHNAGDPAKKR